MYRGRGRFGSTRRRGGFCYDHRPPLTFSTLTFFVFVAAAFAAYWSCSTARARNLVVLAASYVFYGWWDPRYCLLIALSSAVDYAVIRGLSRTDRATARKTLLAVSILVNLGLLGTFKYYDFFAASAVEAAASVGLTLAIEPLRLVLPVGISFYTFQTLGTTIDVYRRRFDPPAEPIAYFAYVAFFPQLVAGPIERGARLLPQLRVPRVFDAAQAKDGLKLLAWGLFQKLALADNLAVMVEAGYHEGSRGPVVVAATTCFAFQIYFDFSGYSNMAVGTARLLGIELSRNFAYPYFSRSVGEFWRRWHITLSTWFRDYVYVPLGGNRRGRRWQVVAVLVTFTVSGLWHGAAWGFVIWGLWNGALALPSILWGTARDGPDMTAGGERPGVIDVLRMLATFVLIGIGWVFFRAQTLTDALRFVRVMVEDAFDPSAYAHLVPHEEFLRAFGPLVAIVVLLEWGQRRHEHPLVFPRLPRSLRWVLYSALGWVTLYLIPDVPNRFIYFQF